MNRSAAIDLILSERLRQEKLMRAGKFPWTCATRNALVSKADKLSVLAEEFGEVARAINDDDPANLKEELVQVAACCLAWLEALP